ncbi:hypothetical protein A6S26_10205 [Nostoc sp. ATCC 43529]|nr:hypothetical protein A6S26_10205 [Nostoc sp. ATCC 43529]
MFKGLRQEHQISRKVASIKYGVESPILLNLLPSALCLLPSSISTPIQTRVNRVSTITIANHVNKFKNQSDSYIRSQPRLKVELQDRSQNPSVVKLIAAFISLKLQKVSLIECKKYKIYI